MTPTERFQLPLRWEFVAVENSADRAIRWKWRAYTQSGRLTLESECDFDTMSECTAHANAAGYGG